MMKIAVVGGGLAGSMVAAHITRFFPHFELYHVHDSSLPALELGVATLPGFTRWLHEITGLGPEELGEQCGSTITRGIQFEGWSHAHPVFRHVFLPGLHGYQLSTIAAAALLKRYTRAIVIDAPVLELCSTGARVDVVMRGRPRLEVEFALDARGWPRILDERHIRLSWLPTNVACVRNGPSAAGDTISRSIARPHGWIFVTPLRDTASYAYIFHGGVSSLSEVEADFDAFLGAESRPSSPSTVLSFPSYCHSTITDGAIFRIGNAASFIEPLGAPSVSSVLLELMSASELLELLTCMALLRGREHGRDRLDAGAVTRINDAVVGHILRASLFVGWHYSNGSVFDTRFWRHARASFWHHLEAREDTTLVREFKQYLAAGAALASGEPHELWNRPFGGYTGLSFAAVGLGSGQFEARARE